MTWLDYVAHEHADQNPHGSLKVAHKFESPQLGNSRDIFVYLPPSYATGDQSSRYPVIYMHDGQNLFDPRTSFAGEWNVDGTIDRASGEGVEAIVVGIPNMGAERCNEYSPFDDPRHGPAKGDAYLSFLIDTLKPVIDADFRTQPDRDATGIAGSSMGGLISLYAFFKRTDVFGFAGVMSPALWYGQRKIYDFLAQCQKVDGRIYVDVGTKEGSEELRDVTRLRDRLLDMGYRHGIDMLFMIDFGAGHTESAWAGRVERELRFFLACQTEADPRVPGVVMTTGAG
jgi:predicted alpha/beta superfamily hydrolase